MTTTIKTLKRLLGMGPRISREQAMAAFGRRYASFNELLQSNADLAAILAKLDAAQRGDKHLETHQVRRIARKAIFHCERMAACLNDMSRGHYKELESSVAAIGQRIENELEKHTRGDVNALILPLTEVDASMGYSVGGKNANLGELSNMLDMPVPPGFAVTIQASSLALLRPSGLFKKIHSTLCKVDADVPHSLQDAARTVQNLILEAPLPEDVEKALLDGWDEAFGKDSQVQAALRSSAVDEDGVQSFAGQYLSILGVTRESLPMAFKRVLASLFSPRALAYRARNGYPLDATSMGMCCLKMVQAKAAGVAFSRHPVDLRSNCVMIQGTWGLGEMVVDGTATPDNWLVSRANLRIQQETIAHKEVRLVLAPGRHGVESQEEDVPESLRHGLSSARCSHSHKRL